MEIIADKNEIKLFNKKNAGEGLGHKIQTIFTRKQVDIDVKQLVNQIKKKTKKNNIIFLRKEFIKKIIHGLQKNCMTKTRLIFKIYDGSTSKQQNMLTN